MFQLALMSCSRSICKQQYQIMGVQLFPVLEGYERDYLFIHRSGDWKSVASMLEELDGIAEQIEIEPISEFINCTRSESPLPFDDEELEEFEQLGELIDGVWYYEGRELWSIEPQWSLPEQGLKTVRALIHHLRSLLPEWDLLSSDDRELDEDTEDYQGALSELEELESVLIKAQNEGKRFRICLSG
ncbi:hypothetical protein H6F86_29795 [Phormidium sp. FACHB-592]|uniref:DUF1877 domain-containing protein n=1 Tax=Stenomitos frigidus AS-A4 TaxID=2933935 RepID=A0ABV0KG17_9CYAN|nr:hypothetical protein [Phormidium sp. FACHB-592]MBD2078009.1 hypothetical protein [Phormidium sp. FACHB-592]